MKPPLPAPKVSWREESSTSRAKLHDQRARWRKQYQSAPYKRLAKWVRGIRSKLKMTQREFSEKLGVSIVTVKRWENVAGFEPTYENREKIEKIAKGEL